MNKVLHSRLLSYLEHFPLFSNRLGPMDQTSNHSDKISCLDDPNYFTTVSLPRPPKTRALETFDGALPLNAAKQSNT